MIIGEAILWGIETAWNAVAAVIEATFLAAVALLPSLPAVPAAPTWVGWMNWFFPVAGVVSVMTALMGSYVTFLAIRWAFKKAGVL
jgi:hypothetical protein